MVRPRVEHPAGLGGSPSDRAERRTCTVKQQSGAGEQTVLSHRSGAAVDDVTEARRVGRVEGKKLYAS